MNNNLTEIVLIVDESGSMCNLRDETIKGINSFLDEQKTTPGDASVTIVAFNSNVRTIMRSESLKRISHITYEDYRPLGGTALLDAVGSTIDRVGDRLRETPESERPGKVMVVIITDGAENMSYNYSYERVKNMIQHQTDKYSWKFIFLGSNIDAKKCANTIGIQPDYAASYTSSNRGVDSVYSSISRMTVEYKSCTDSTINTSLLSNIE